MAYEVPPYINTRNIYQYTPSEYLPSIYGQYGKEFNFNRDSYDNWQLPYYQDDFLPLIPEQVDYNYDDYKYLHYVPNGGSEQHATVETDPYVPYFSQRETENWSDRIKTTPQRSQMSIDSFTSTGKELESVFSKKNNNFSPNKAANIAKSGIGLATAIADDIGSAVRANRSQVTPLKFTYNTDGYNTFSDLNNFRKNELSYNTLEKPNKGAQTGDVFKRFGRGAASGASLGASIGGPWGAAIGAIAGAVGGLGSGIAKALTENSRYRKDIGKTNKLNRLYNTQFNEATSDILSNINIKNANTMNRQRLYNTFAEGGAMGMGDNFGVTQFNSGGSHETNPNGGIPQGIENDGQPALVEEGEVRWNDFIFSNRIKPQQDVLSKFNSRMNKEFASYADMANKILDMHKERENNPFDKSTLNIQMQRLADAQEYQKLSEEAAQYGLSPEEYQMYQEQANQQMAYGGHLYDGGGYKGGPKNNKRNTWDLDQVAPVNFSDTQDMSISGPSQFTNNFSKYHPNTAYYLRKFAGQWQRMLVAERNLDDAEKAYIEAANSYANGQMDEKDFFKYYQDYERAYTNGISLQKDLEYYTKMVQNICAYYEVADKKYGLTGNKSVTYGIKRYLSEQGMFNAPVDTHPYRNDTWIYYHILRNPKLIEHFQKLDKEKPSVFSSLRAEGTTPSNQFESGNKNLMLNYTLDSNNRVMQTLPNLRRMQFENEQFDGAEITQRSPERVTRNTVPTITSVGGVGYNSPRTQNNTQNTNVRYWDAKNKKYFDTRDPNASDIYTITGEGAHDKSFDGRIDYNDNPDYVSKVIGFSDDDWDKILKQLQGAYPGKYDHYTIPKLKEKANDHLFGNIHKEILNYVANMNTESPEEKSNIVDDEEVLNNSETPTETKTNSYDTRNNVNEYETTDKREPYPWYAEALRYAPVFNNLEQVLTQNNPDYTYARQIASLYQPETARPVGQYQRYQPIDQYYTATNARNQGNTMYGFYKNNGVGQASSANAYATLAANLAKSAANNAYIAAVNTNNQQRNAAIAANNQIDLANEQARHEAQRANITNYTNIMSNAYRAAEEERLAVENAREANKQNLADNLAAIGREQFDRWRINSDPSLAYKVNWDYKNIIPMYTALISEGWTVDKDGNWTAPKKS